MLFSAVMKSSEIAHSAEAMRSPMEPSRLVNFNTAVCLVALAVALPWTAMSGYGWLSRTFLTLPFVILCVCGLVFQAASLFYGRVRQDLCLARILHASAWLPVMIFSAVVLTYLVPTLQMPMADAHLAAIDTMIGFDFKGFVTWGEPAGACSGLGVLDLWPHHGRHDFHGHGLPHHVEACR